MPPNSKVFYDENDDKLEYDDAPIEPSILIPPAVSTLSVNHSAIENGTLKKFSWTTRFSGIMYSLVASFVFTCTTFIIKQLGIDLLDAFFIRFTVQITSNILYVHKKNYHCLPGAGIQIFSQFLCCGTGAGCFFLYFFAIRYIELPDVTTLVYTRVVWTLVLSIILYRERPSKVSLISIPLTLLGVILVAQPTFLFSSNISSAVLISSKLRVLGSSLSICSAIASAINVLAFKQLISTSKTIKPSVLTLHYCLAVFCFLIAYQLHKQLFFHTRLTFDYVVSWRFLLASTLGTIVIIPNILSQKAIKREHPAVFTLLGSADIIFALILQNIFTTKRSNLFALIGSALVILSVVILGASKIINERRLQKQVELKDIQCMLHDTEEKQ
ncbi:unnamed protein product [Rotaria magnacalcarata]|uniref:EamA domain-containing protein n=2 Tax=Rotaria magnacalcarata TaxID=392030 RepID=A0A816QHQ4_9BILA|nr:unnamed protein product [Rotaria magnacalcarata]CAF2092830.1 unnamed protein product [Rotaria magnacalcarata]CAF3747266.1 unnamed protein product [Rotaria magnacalcarata]CAF3788922.1 unnamed protein product [Rotaria magnacalcarata]